ncbi:MAG: type IV pilus twitching motility protein PilT [Candidatus Nomurabacteria bacterium]|jgi:twitching motility protein PilT|nr:type IV pilus twitching motility protein PilT [Candidatus Nomurabacteria bacterium]
MEQLKIETLLERVVRQNASDLHLRVGVPPMLRIDGVLSPINDAAALNDETIQGLVYSILDDEQRAILTSDKEFDFSFNFGDLGRFRANAFRERGLLAASLRFIPNEIKSVTELGLPAAIETLADLPKGLVLVTGPTGSGKSTTLAALIDKINREKPVNIITVEDPIEFSFKSNRSIVAQRELHYDTLSFNMALRSVLREDPDVIMVGELRDLETISSALTIAETGHLVFGTLHTASAAQSIDRMINVFPAHQQPQIKQQLASVLEAVVSQRLIPAIGGGRVAASEILLATTAVRNIVREGKTHQLDAVIQTSGNLGMQSMDNTLAGMIKTGKITMDEARNYAVDAEELARIVGG